MRALDLSSEVDLSSRERERESVACVSVCVCERSFFFINQQCPAQVMNMDHARYAIGHPHVTFTQTSRKTTSIHTL